MFAIGTISVEAAAERLVQARLNAGCKSASEAATEHRWGYSTYASHENRAHR